MLALIQNAAEKSDLAVWQIVAGSAITSALVAKGFDLFRDWQHARREEDRESREESRTVAREKRDEERRWREARHARILLLLPQITSKLEKAERAIEEGLSMARKDQTLTVGGPWYLETLQTLDALVEDLRRETVVLGHVVVTAGVAIPSAMADTAGPSGYEDGSAGLEPMHRAFRIRRLEFEEALRVELGWASPALDGDGT